MLEAFEPSAGVTDDAHLLLDIARQKFGATGLRAGEARAERQGSGEGEHECVGAAEGVGCGAGPRERLFAKPLGLANCSLLHKSARAVFF